jgi:hypothetical protein
LRLRLRPTTWADVLVDNAADVDTADRLIRQLRLRGRARVPSALELASR